MPAAPRLPPTDELVLPDLDKSDESDDVDVGTFELAIGDDAEGPDDASAVDAFEVDIQVLTDPGSNEAATDLDIGEAGLADTLPEVAEGSDDEPADESAHELDDLVQSPLESDDPSTHAELGDDGLEALPDLVVEEGDGEAGPDHERAFLPSAPEGAIPQGPTYEAEWLLLGSSCSALATDGTDVLAAAEHLMRFGHERRSDALPAGTKVTSLAATADATLLSTTRGLMAVKPDGALSFQDAPEPTRGSGAELAELAGSQGSYPLWARLRNGALLRRRGDGWELHQTGGAVMALSASGSELALLVVSRRPTLQLSSDGGSSFRERLLPEPAQTVAGGGAPALATRGDFVALADGERGLAVSADAGATFRLVIGAVNVTAVAYGEHAGRPAIFAALYRESKDVTELIAVDPRSGEALRIATLSVEAEEDAEESGRTSALLWQDGKLWSAGGYGLVRLTAPR
ncbi:MAG: hypothetical protein EOO73_32810 [Myxococcales bacterium]|nr:MAG: hypothetical protein EOO73_32810 [Myxococcales bacterium]